MQLPVCPEHHQLIQEQLMEITQSDPPSAVISLEILRPEPTNVQVQALNMADTKDWHKTITRDHRSFLLQKLLQTQSPMPDPSDRRIQNLILHIRRVEGRMFEVANTKSEYYQLWVKRVERLRRGLEERRSKRHEHHDHQLGNQVCNLNVSIALIIQNTDLPNKIVSFLPPKSSNDNTDRVTMQS